MSINNKFIALAFMGLVAIHTTWPMVTADGVDKDGYTCHGAGKCYKVIRDKVNKKTAMEKCKALGGGTLVSIHSAEESDFIWGLISAADPKENHDYWIGLLIHRHRGDQTVIGANWVDGTELNYGSPEKLPKGTRPWCSGEPNFYEEEEECTVFRNGGGQNNCWNDMPCKKEIHRVPLGYVCQKQPRN